MTIATLSSHNAKGSDIKNMNNNKGFSYNTKIYKYADGCQVRKYKHNINKLSDEEKEKRRLAREHNKQFRERMLQNDGNPFYDGKTSLFDTLDVNAERSILASVARTKNTIYQLARSEKWEYFITLTFSPDFVDSYDYDNVVEKLTNWLNNIKKRVATELAYVIVPELHKSGRYHFHGLIKNINGLKLVDSGHRTNQDAVIYNIENYKLGFSTATKIVDSAKACGYFTKYITKDLCCLTKNKKRYWASRNIERCQAHAFDFTDEQFNTNILEQFDDFLSTSKSVLVTDGVSEINHISYYEFSDKKVK